MRDCCTGLWCGNWKARENPMLLSQLMETNSPPLLRSQRQYYTRLRIQALVYLVFL